MREVLVNPQAGYYMHRDVFGQAGDFTTSPEVSQMFGEMIGVWMLNEWFKAGMPQPVQLVETGPGRGTLMSDIIRVFSKYNELIESLHVRLVEVSPHLARVQEECLCGTSTASNWTGDAFKTSTSRNGIPISWYRDIQLVPKAFSFFLAHEFLDALPVHKFQRTESGWREILVDICESPDSPLHLKMVLTPSRSPATMLIPEGEERKHLEICPQAGVFVEHLAERLEESGGVSLIVDYGHMGEKEDTFRAFKNHQLHDPLSLPGSADLTADVDFEYLRRCVEGKAYTFGPVSQGKYLTSMGIGVRLRKLLEVTRDRKEAENLLSAYDMLVSPQKMGERFKFFAMFPKAMTQLLESNPPAGF
ncbi:protein arginine methyltransferase NDUFAF7, mitochondrial [Galendromus occidentalis]|uniref:Protein arginine methyltransferase NDUFAF7 n=1 Tax=Galendromus occidentalis TaxID=34638 RepID=A0AAJ6QTI9_9ACAR|nr:protein arginine methyltransferase NDUFAF7, mitochondrial [Galendromus occidentalis]